MWKHKIETHIKYNKKQQTLFSWVNEKKERIFPVCHLHEDLRFIKMSITFDILLFTTEAYENLA